MRKWSWALVAALLVVALGCGLFGMGEQVEEVFEEVEKELEEAETSEETTGPESPSDEEPSEESGAEDADFDPEALKGLDSYRYTMNIRAETADGTVQETTMEIAATRDPAASHTILSGGAMQETEMDFEIIQIGDQQWIKYGEDWMQTEVVEEDPFDFQENLPFSMEDLDEETLDKAEFVGKETVNGLPTRHYVVGTDAIEAEILGWERMVDNVEDASMDVWIVDEGDLPPFAVKMIVDVTGIAPEDNTDALVNFRMSVEITDINADITIEPPEVSESGGLPEDIPAYPDTQNQVSMPGMVTFETMDAFETVVEFYISEMEAAGWNLEDGRMSAETMDMQTWTKDTRTVQVMISREEEAELTSATIMIQGEE